MEGPSPEAVKASLARQKIKADKVKPWKVYPEIGWDPVAQRVDINAPQPGRERIERNLRAAGILA